MLRNRYRDRGREVLRGGCFGDVLRRSKKEEREGEREGKRERRDSAERESAERAVSGLREKESERGRNSNTPLNLVRKGLRNTVL
jgi:hypothetical protein